MLGSFVGFLVTFGEGLGAFVCRLAAALATAAALVTAGDPAALATADASGATFAAAVLALAALLWASADCRGTDAAAGFAAADWMDGPLVGWMDEPLVGAGAEARGPLA